MYKKRTDQNWGRGRTRVYRGKEEWIEGRMLSRDQSPEVGRETSLDESKESVRQSDGRKKRTGEGRKME